MFICSRELETEYCTSTVRRTQAHHPRYFRSSTIGVNDKLDIVYRIYTAKNADTHKEQVPFNFIFSHPGASTKAVWHYHICKLFEIQATSARRPAWRINAVVAFDAANQGDSAYVNRGKLGISNDWRDNANDTIAIIEKESLHVTGKLVSVGHSFGGVTALWACYLNPNLFDSSVLFEPAVFDPLNLKVVTKRTFRLLTDKSRSEFDSWKDARDAFYSNSYYKRAIQPIKDFIFQQEYYEDSVEIDGVVTKKIRRTSPATQSMSLYASYANISAEVYAALQYIKTPIVHVAGTIPNWLSAEVIEDVRNRLPCVISKPVIQGGNHMTPYEKPDEIINIIVNHLESRSKAFLEEASANLINSDMVEYTPEEKQKIYAEWEKDFFDFGYKEHFFDPKPKL